MTGRGMWGAVAAAGWLVLAGCGTGTVPVKSDAAAPDPDGGPGDPDASQPQTAGLVIEFRASPNLPASVGGPSQTELNDRAVMRLLDVEAVGEAAVGDDRTRAEQVELDWREPEAEDDPWDTRTTVSYPSAPVGSYSNLVFRLERFDFRGELEDDDVEIDFRIEDELGANTVVVDLLGATVSAGTVTTVIIDVDVVTAVSQIDWSLVTVDDGKKVVDSGDPQLPDVESALRVGFAARAPQ